MGSQVLSGQVAQHLARGFSLLQKQHGPGLSTFRSGDYRSLSRSILPRRPGHIALSPLQTELRPSTTKPNAAKSHKLGVKIASENGFPKQLKGLSKGYGSVSKRAGFSVKASAEAQTVARHDTGMESASQGAEEKWEIKMLYDGDCPLCMREVNMLRKRDAETGNIKFVDIASDDYNPSDNANIDFEMAMGRIHGIQRDGTIVTNVEAFRKFYEAVGLGWVYAITKNKAVLKAADAVYDVWAKYRMQVTGRPPIEQVIEERKRRQEQLKGTGKDRCRIDPNEF